MKYQELVKRIRGLDWCSLDSRGLQRLMVLSAYSAREFGESLRLTLELHPRNLALKQMASEELRTDNLSFGDYNQKGDHSEFLGHFIDKYDLLQKDSDLKRIGERYMARIRALPEMVRVMSIVSRERELPGIFTQILTAPDWKAKGLPEYRYYLQRHIDLDSDEGGHADMLSNFQVDDSIVPFYEARLNMYRCLPKLFEK